MTENRFVLDTNAVIFFITGGNIIPIVDISPAIKKEAIALRHSTKIKLPDCIIAATSIVLNAVLLTDDDKLLRLTYPGYTAQPVS